MTLSQSQGIREKTKMDKPLNEEEWKDAVYELAYDRLIIKECPKCGRPYVQGWICPWCGYDTGE